MPRLVEHFHGIKIMDIGIKMDVCSQKWDQFSFRLIGNVSFEMHLKNVSKTLQHSCQKVNGCLQVLKGSHKMGRIDHTLVGELAGAEEERLNQAKKAFPLVHCEMNPGDALFFNCNLLHAR